MKTKSKLFDRGFVFLFLIAATLAGSGLFFYIQVRTDRITALLASGESIAAHFIVRDEDRLVFSEIFLYSPRTGQGALIDIPGNVGTIIESLRRVDRIDVLFKPDNTGPYRSQVERFTGISVPFYFVFSLEDIERFVDVLGGIELFIANSVETDSRGNKVLLPSGNVLLDGAKVRSYLALSDPEESEIDRIGRIQKVLQGMLKKIGDEAQYLTGREVLSFLRSAVKTNLDGRALSAFVREIVKLDVDRIVLQRVLGTMRTVDNHDLLFPHFEGQLLRQTVKQIVESIETSGTRRADELTTTVEVLNGTKTAGLARRTREIFVSFGFDVVSISNAESQDVDKTLVIDRRGNPEAAGKVAQVIRCSRVLTEIPEDGSAAAADVTIILGRDFDGRYCK